MRGVSSDLGGDVGDGGEEEIRSCPQRGESVVIVYYHLLSGMEGNRRELGGSEQQGLVWLGGQ